jgi:hypothetical protein
MENQINRYSNQKMMMDKVQYNHDTVQDTIEMGRYLEQTNKIQLVFTTLDRTYCQTFLEYVVHQQKAVFNSFLILPQTIDGEVIE